MQAIDCQTPEFAPCGLGRRCLVMLYDGLIVVALLMLAAAVALPLDRGQQQAGVDFLYTTYLLGVWFLYLAWNWRRAGMTLGMRAWRVRLLAEDGKPLGWFRCAIRFGVSLASFAVLGAGFAWSLADPRRRCWHDRASRTRLVMVAKPQVARRKTR